MSRIAEKTEWADGIYELRQTDAVLGGSDGISNMQAAQLAGRTQWLKSTVESHAAAPDPHPQYREVSEAVQTELDSLAETVDTQGGNLTALAKDVTVLAGDFQAWMRETRQLLGTVPAPPGTQMLFVQSTAPVGWTKISNHHDKVLRIVSGSASMGGTVPFSDAFSARSIIGAIGETTLTVTQIPGHTHSYNIGATGGSWSDSGGYTGRKSSANTGTSGGNGSHTHSLEIDAPDFNVQYVDAIIASKDGN